MDQVYLGVEIGGTKQQIAVCNEKGAIVEMISEKVDHPNGAADILHWLEQKIPQLLARYPQIHSIGVGFGGPLETKTGRVLISVQVPGWKDFELKTWFEASFGLPTVVVVDTVAGGYAELKLGSGVGSRKFFYTNIGTGIGGSLFVDGKTWFACHGHRSGANPTANDLPRLPAGSVVLSGHTHIPVLEENPDGVLLFNPGSTSIPKGGFPASYGVYEDGKFAVVSLEGERIL